MRAIRRLGEDHQDPLEGVANLFDLGIVFALGFFLSLLASMQMSELLMQKEMTLVKNPGSKQMEIIRKKGIQVERYRVSQEQLGGDGIKLGTAYQLKNGDVVYIPESPSKK